MVRRSNRSSPLWLALGGLSLAGCAIHTPLGLPATALAPPAGEAPELTYTFHLVRDPALAVEVELELAGAPGGNTALRIAESWAGIERPADAIHHLQVEDGDRVRLPLERTDPFRWRVHHRDPARLRIRWRLEPSGRPEVHSPDYYYRPIVEPGRFQLIGNTGLLFPEHLADGRPRPIGIRWRGFTEAGWRVVCSHGAAQDELVVVRDLDALRHAIFLAGPLRLHRRDIRGRPLAVAMLGEWAFSDEQFVDLAARIVEVERDFFADHDYPYYLISLLPVGPRVPGRIATGGTGLTDSFALFLGPGLSLAPGSRDRRRLAHLLAHELFHNWNGRKIDREQPEELVYWFSEGFTDFYTLRLLYRAGLFDLDAMLDELNSLSVAYHTNPRRDAPNRQVQAAFWTDEQVRELPYQRGALIALRLDAEIRRGSDERQSLDDLMRALFRHAVETGERIDNRRLLGWFARYTSDAFAAAIGRVIEGQVPLELPADLLAPCLTIETRSIGQYELGFDRERSLDARRITGVLRGSAAWRAGLRDGQPLLGWSIESGRPDHQVELTVLEGEVRRPVSYYPQRDPKPVPWFRIDRPEACPGIL